MIQSSFYIDWRESIGFRNLPLFSHTGTLCGPFCLASRLRHEKQQGKRESASRLIR
jgi:hypothetical protein